MTAPWTLALWALVAIAVLLILRTAARRPQRFRITRTAVIKAPPARVFALINDLKTFNTWSRYLRGEAARRGHYSGPASGVGATYAWQGRKTGGGSLTITRSEAPAGLAMTLSFVQAASAQQGAEFSLWAEGEQLTIVSWVVHGPAPYRLRLRGLFVDMDHAVGKALEADLANLKSLAQGR
jgi:uncharacterized protein YndB with AHSA1/START domain